MVRRRGLDERGSEVLLYDKFDIWEVAATGTKAARLTDGAAEQVEYRYADLDPDAEPIDRSKPMYLDMNGVWTKKSGYARLVPGGVPEKLVWLDKSVTRLAKAKDADVYAYVVQSHDDSPDAFVGGADLKAAKQVTATNAFQSKYAWGRAELVEFKSEKGQRLQGVLRYPAGYEPREEVPDDRLRLREALGFAAPVHRAVRAGLLQRVVVHERRLLLLRARHRVSSARARTVGGRVRAPRRRRRRRRWASSIRSASG